MFESRGAKILIGIVGVSIFLVLVGVLIAFFFTGGREDTTAEQGSFFGAIGERLFDGDTQGQTQQEDGKITFRSESNNRFFPEATTLPPLRTLWNTPVSGVGVFGTSTTRGIRLVERSSGHIYEADPETGAVVRISNTTIPGIQKALFSQTGERVLLFLLTEAGSVQVVLTEIQASSTPTGTIYEFENTVIDSDVAEAVFSPDGTQVLYTQKTGGNELFLFSISTGSVRVVATTPIEEWQLSWGGGSPLITTAPSVFSPGFTYELSLQAGTLSRIFGNQFGLTALQSPNTDGQSLFSFVSENGLGLATRDNDGVMGFFSPIATLSEKCVFANTSADLYCGIPNTLETSELPDAWYQGRVLFNDALFRLSEGEASLLTFPEVALDVLRPVVGKEDRFLVFVNKHDLIPWILDTQQEQ